jgi:uncharacterized protein (TIGR03435 family)
MRGAFQGIPLALIAATCLGQTQFEVASVRAVPAGKQGLTAISPSGAASFAARNITLEVLIELAYGVDENQIAGKPGWLALEYYDVSAKPEGAGGLTYQQLRQPLQRLLEQRFHLATHFDTKEIPGYALVAAKGGAKLKPSQGEASQPNILPDGIRARGIPVATLASMLARPAGRPVVDKTGIEGNFDITLKYAPENPADSSLPSMFTALQEQLGLKLEPHKIPQRILVIDRVEKTPVEN